MDKSCPHGSDSELNYFWLIMESGPQPSSENLPPGQGTGKLWESMLPGSDHEYREVFKRWEQKAFLEALPGQCVERWFNYFADMNG